MNFYIGSSVDDLDLTSNNIEFDEEICRYLDNYAVKNSLDENIKVLYSITPYDDVEIHTEDIKRIIWACNLLLNSSILYGYEYCVNAMESVELLKSLSEAALENNELLISIGD